MRVRVVAIALAAVACSGCGWTSAKSGPRVRVPNLVGASWGAAVDRIGRTGLCVGAVTTGLGTITSPADAVLRQSPRPGTKVALHARVSLTVSPSGPSGSVMGYSLPGCEGEGQFYVAPGG
jgi:PASTA domain